MDSSSLFPYSIEPHLLRVPASFRLDMLLEHAMLVADRALEEGLPDAVEAGSFPTESNEMVGDDAAVTEHDMDENPKHHSLEYDSEHPPLPSKRPKVDGPSVGAEPQLNSSHRRRRKMRAAKKATLEYVPRPAVKKKLLQSSTKVETQLNTDGLDVASGEYGGKTTKIVGVKVAISPERVLSMGLKRIPCDGKKLRIVLDAHKRLIALFVMCPDNKMFNNTCQMAYDAILDEGRHATFSTAERSHPRGKFPAINFGITHSTGTLAPVNLNTGVHSAMIRRLRENQYIQMLATFASTTFATWNPGVYAYYRERLMPLFTQMPHLERNFERSVYPTAAINFGPQVRTYKHKDVMNCPFGWCSIQALGNFNPQHGGHIMLWECEQMHEFPPNSVAFIFSATITHSNTPVGKDETRISFTQYCPGGLLRYVDNGFRTEEEFRLEDPAGFDKMCALKKSRWKEGLKLISNYDAVTKEINEN